MRVVIAGGHGKIALLLERMLTGRGDQAVALIRNPAQADDIEQTGAVPVVLDLEAVSPADVAAVLAGTDAVVFAAGAGPGSGAARKDTVDRAASVLVAEAAGLAGVRRFVQISGMGVDQRPAAGTDQVWAAYLAAKAAAEEDLRARDLDWTILRPGGLTDDKPTGKVALAPPPLPRGQVPRADAAAVVLTLLDEPHTSHLTLDLTSGSTPVGGAAREIAHS
ncbi:MAG TPA: NAD(P)-binding oxidoreductase [Streptosporangiaceae bacterium]|nr:NAD(P)-binding oxidoreductase [Streptosporangiaceae bacterium]